MRPSTTPINNPTAAKPKQPGAWARADLTIHADWFREHRRKSAYAELRGDLWHSGELLGDRGMSERVKGEHRGGAREQEMGVCLLDQRRGNSASQSNSCALSELPQLTTIFQ
jgi:hypothetical protein